MLVLEVSVLIKGTLGSSLRRHHSTERQNRRGPQDTTCPKDICQLHSRRRSLGRAGTERTHRFFWAIQVQSLSAQQPSILVQLCPGVQRTPGDHHRSRGRHCHGRYATNTADFVPSRYRSKRSASIGIPYSRRSISGPDRSTIECAASVLQCRASCTIESGETAEEVL